jgi:hypothetical protein
MLNAYRKNKIIQFPKMSNLRLCNNFFLLKYFGGV